MKNRDMKEVPLNLNKTGSVHTNPDGKTKVKVTKVGAEYFSRVKKGKGKGKKVVKLKKAKDVGSSGLFPNHLEFSGWLYCNNLATVDTEEIDEKWS